MPRSRVVQLFGLLACAALIFAASTRIPAINTARSGINVRAYESAVENAPPEYAFAVQVLGAFRGLITDIAFIRAEQFKEQGRYFDAAQLAEWICLLQPHFPTVWEFNAWNMAWNISVTTFTPEERWNWVYNGVKLLRDRGIPLNPRAVNLYKQLAWTFNNKMGEPTDEYHMAYKINWAYRMHLLLGAPPDPYLEFDPNEVQAIADDISSTADVDRLLEAGRETAKLNEEKRKKLAEARGWTYTPQKRDADQRDPGQARMDVTRWAAAAELKAIEDAPDTLAALYAAQPGAEEVVQKLRALGIAIDDDTELDEDNYWRTNGLAFTFFKPYRDAADPVDLLRTLQRDDATPDPNESLVDQLRDILGLRTHEPAGREFVRYLQKRVLKNVYKLDPEHMLFLTERFGAIDWRSVDAQSLYWTSRGLVAAGETVNDFTNDKLNTARILFFSLRNLFLYNRIVFVPNHEHIFESYLNRTVDPTFAAALNDAYVKYGPLMDPDIGRTGGAGDSYKSGHVNFLSEIIRYLYLAGLEDEAEYYYRQLQDMYGTLPDGKPNPALAKRLDDYVVDSFLDELDVPSVRGMIIMLSGMLQNAYTQLGAGNVERCFQIVTRGRDLWVNYMKSKQESGYERLWIQSYENMQIDVFGQCLVTPLAGPAAALERVRLWQRAPLFLRQAVYDDLQPVFAAICKQLDFDETKAFPEPADMETYRISHPPRRSTEMRPDSDVRTLPGSN